MTSIEGISVTVASRSDLILLKLYAGEAQDAWDIASLHRDIVAAEVEAGLGRLPPEARAFWKRVRGARAKR